MREGAEGREEREGGGRFTDTSRLGSSSSQKSLKSSFQSCCALCSLSAVLRSRRSYNSCMGLPRLLEPLNIEAVFFHFNDEASRRSFSSSYVFEEILNGLSSTPHLPKFCIRDEKVSKIHVLPVTVDLGLLILARHAIYLLLGSLLSFATPAAPDVLFPSLRPPGTSRALYKGSGFLYTLAFQPHYTEQGGGGGPFQAWAG